MKKDFGKSRQRSGREVGKVGVRGKLRQGIDLQRIDEKINSSILSI